VDFNIPAPGYGEHWQPVLDTADPALPPGDAYAAKAGEVIRMTSRSLRLLRRV
jgi:hypothetical protein